MKRIAIALFAFVMGVGLNVQYAEAAKRLGFGAGPTVAFNPRAAWLAMMRDRRALYEQLATVTVAERLDLLKTPEAIELVLAALPGRP